MDKGGSFHTLMLDKDKTLGQRISDFVSEDKRK